MGNCQANQRGITFDDDTITDETLVGKERPKLPSVKTAKIEDYYESIENGFIARGNFGAVFRTRRKRDGRLFAVKLTKPTRLDRRDGQIFDKEDAKERCQEIKTLKLMQGRKHVMQMVAFFFNRGELHIVMELYCETLRAWIRRQETFDGAQARQISHAVLLGIKALHDANIIHRDIKADNIMFKRTDDFKSLKIVDLGLAHCIDHRPVRVLCGSPGYMAPEMFAGEKYGVEVDMFSFGSMMFRILSSKPAFPNYPEEVMRDATLQLRYRMDGPEWSEVPHEAQDLILMCLSYQNERVSAKDALAHPWFSRKAKRASLLLNEGTFIGEHAGTASGAMLGDDMTEVDEVTMVKSANGMQFWACQSMQHVLTNLVSSGGFYGRIVAKQDGYILIEEESMATQAVTLPRYLATIRRYTELECRNVFRRMVLCVGAFHDAGVAHRNLNPLNFVVEEGGFGSARPKVHIRGIQYSQSSLNGRPITGRIGHTKRVQFQWWAYIAPEIDNHFMHDERVDLWSLGVMLYTLLCGIGPFAGSQNEIQEKKNLGVVRFEVFKPSLQAQHLVEGLLQVDPASRLSIDEILSHPWMNEPEYELASIELNLAQSAHRDFEKRLRES